MYSNTYQKHGFFFTKLAGVSFEGRQYIAASLNIGDILYFEREPSNPYDKFAVKVMTSNNQQVGYISKQFSEQISTNILNGVKYNVTVSSITGGGFDSNYGVNIKVEY